MPNPPRSPRNRRTPFLIALISLAAMGCAKHPTETAKSTATAPTEPDSVEQSEVQTPLHGSWILIQLGDEPLAAMAAPQPPRIQFQHPEGRIVGFTGCNRMMGGYSVNGERDLSFDQLGSTQRACMPSGPEGRFIQGLSETAHYRLDKGELVFIDAENADLLRFRKAD